MKSFFLNIRILKIINNKIEEKPYLSQFQPLDLNATEEQEFGKSSTLVLVLEAVLFYTAGKLIGSPGWKDLKGHPSSLISGNCSSRNINSRKKPAKFVKDLELNFVIIKITRFDEYYFYFQPQEIILIINFDL